MQQLRVTQKEDAGGWGVSGICEHLHLWVGKWTIIQFKPTVPTRNDTKGYEGSRERLSVNDGGLKRKIAIFPRAVIPYIYVLVAREKIFV